MLIARIILLSIFRWVFKLTVTVSIWPIRGLILILVLKTPVSDCTNVNSHSGIYDAQGNRKSDKK